MLKRSKIQEPRFSVSCLASIYSNDFHGYYRDWEVLEVLRTADFQIQNQVDRVCFLISFQCF